MEEFKNCRSCNTDKLVSEFYKDLRNNDGLRSYCKVCVHIKARKQRVDHTDVYTKKEKKYYAEHRDLILKKRNEYNIINRHKQRARSKVKYALKMGYLVKPNECESCCKVAFLEGHHKDYSKPLEVQWLCRSCHRMIDFGKY